MPRRHPTLSLTQETQARALWATHTFQEIGAIFQVSRHVISGIAHRRGWPLKSVIKRIQAGKAALSARQEATALRLWATRSYTEIGARFGVSRNVIAGLANRRNWPLKTVQERIQNGLPALTPRQEARALRMWPFMTYAEIGVRFSVSRNVIAGLSHRRSWPLKRDLALAA